MHVRFTHCIDSEPCVVSVTQHRCSHPRSSAEARPQLGCGLEKLLNTRARVPRPQDPVITVGEDSDGRPLCAPADSRAAQAALLRDLQASGKINCERILPPVQVDSNCWFNTMFMAIFVSDKGRKFFRFFRQLMIEGKHADGRPIVPKLRYAFLLLNACASAALGGSMGTYVPESTRTLALDTNAVLQRIYNAIPKRGRTPWVRKKGEAGNPWQYYASIMHYLGDKRVRHLAVSHPPTVAALLRGSDSPAPLISPSWRVHGKEAGMYYVQPTESTWSPPPDVIVLDIDAWAPTQRKSARIKVAGHQYELDSAVVRDNTGNHFCIMLTCGGKEMAFDGAAFTRLRAVKWKGWLNKDRNWSFEGSTRHVGSPELFKWNFRKGYQMLFYYRV